MKRTKIEIESRFHRTRAAMLARPHAKKAGEYLVTERQWREAVAKCCPGRLRGHCSCPITTIGPWELEGPDASGDYHIVAETPRDIDAETRDDARHNTDGYVSSISDLCARETIAMLVRQARRTIGTDHGWRRACLAEHLEAAKRIAAIIEDDYVRDALLAELALVQGK